MVAAGSGSRLGASLPKALVPLDGVPLVRRSVEAMHNGGAATVAVTMPQGYETEFEQALTGLDYVVLTHGGAERQDSVRQGLAALAPHSSQRSIVLIHDAARPLVPVTVVAAVVQAVAAGAEAVIPVVEVHDTIRSLTPAGSTVVDRNLLRAVQTPQGFRMGMLHRAHAQVAEQGLSLTDDAAAVERLGLPVVLVPGHRDAMKITEAVDLVLAAAILTEREAACE